MFASSGKNRFNDNDGNWYLFGGIAYVAFRQKNNRKENHRMNGLAKLLELFANVGANSASLYLSYQPKMPKKMMQ